MGSVAHLQGEQHTLRESSRDQREKEWVFEEIIIDNFPTLTKDSEVHASGIQRDSHWDAL
jgi:hypothetical protein